MPDVRSDIAETGPVYARQAAGDLPEQLPISVRPSTLLSMLTAGGYHLWVTDQVAPPADETFPGARRRDAPVPGSPLYWYWAREAEHPGSERVFDLDEVPAFWQRFGGKPDFDRFGPADVLTFWMRVSRIPVAARKLIWPRGVEYVMRDPALLLPD